MTGHRGTSWGSVERMAWVGGRAVLAMRIIGSKIFEDRPTISTSLCHSRLWSVPSEAGDNRS